MSKTTTEELTEDERSFLEFHRENEALEFIWTLKEIEGLAKGIVRGE